VVGLLNGIVVSAAVMPDAQIQDPVQRLINYNVIPEGSNPSDYVARYQFFAMVNSMMGQSDKDYESDDDRSSDYITREEFAVYLAQLLSLEYDPEAEFDGMLIDVISISEDARGAVFALLNAGIVSAPLMAMVPVPRFNPVGYLTIEDMAASFSNAFGGIISEDTANLNFYGTVIINKGDISLEGITINGDLIIAEGVSMHSLSLNGVTITGRLIVRGMGAEIILADTKISTIVIEQQARGVTVNVNTDLDYLFIFANNVSVNSSHVIGEVRINADAGTVVLRSVNHISIEGSGNRIYTNENIALSRNIRGQNNTIIWTQRPEPPVTQRPPAAQPPSFAGEGSASRPPSPTQPTGPTQPMGPIQPTGPTQPGAVTGVVMNEDNFVMAVGDNSQLTVSVLPQSAVNRDVTWTSSNTNVLTVNANGLVSAVGEGYATITVTTVDGGFADTVTITALIRAITRVGSQFNIVPSLPMVNGNDDFIIDAGDLLGINALQVTSIRFYDESGAVVRTVNVNFTQTDLDNGTAVFNLAYWLGAEGLSVSGFTFLNNNDPVLPDFSVGPQFVVSPPIRRDHGMTPRIFVVADALARLGENALQVAGVRVYAQNIYGGLHGSIAPAFGPSGNPLGETFNFDTFAGGVHDFQVNAPVFTVRNLINDNAIFVMDFFWGHIYVTGYTFVDVNGVRVDPAVEGPVRPVESITIYEGDVSVIVNRTTDLTAIVLPLSVADRSVSWTSSNTSIATVDANGRVMGIAPGTATITATTTEGGFTDSITVTVNPRLIIYDNGRFDLVPYEPLVTTASNEPNDDFVINVADLLPQAEVLRVSGLRLYVEPQGVGSWGGAVSYGGPHAVINGVYSSNMARFGTNTGDIPLINGTLTFERSYAMFTLEDIQNGTAVFYIEYWWGGGLNITGFSFIDIDYVPADGPRFRLMPPVTRNQNTVPRAFYMEAGARLGSNALQVTGVRVYVQNVGAGFAGSIAPVYGEYGHAGSAANPRGQRVGSGGALQFVNTGGNNYTLTFNLGVPAFTQADFDNNVAAFRMDIFYSNLTLMGYTFLDMGGDVIQPAGDAAPGAIAHLTIFPRTVDIDDIIEGGSVQLTASVRPNTAPQNVTWSSSDTDVATVNATGQVRALTAGTAVITATTIGGALTDTVTITVVELPVTRINNRFILDTPMRVDDYFIFDAGRLLGSNALQVAGIRIYARGIYPGFVGSLVPISGSYSSNPLGLRVTRGLFANVPYPANAEALTHQLGTTVFTQGNIDGNQAFFRMDNFWRYYTLVGFTFLDINGNNVLLSNETPIAITGVTISPATAEIDNILEGDTIQLSVTVTPNTASQGAEWTSSDTNVATVGPSGLVTGVGSGTAVITATSGGISDTVTVNVIELEFNRVANRFMLDPTMLIPTNGYFIFDAGYLMDDAALQVAGIRIYGRNIYGGLTGSIAPVSGTYSSNPRGQRIYRRYFDLVDFPAGTEALTFQLPALAFTQANINNNEAVFRMQLFWGHYTLVGFTFLDVNGNPVLLTGEDIYEPPRADYYWSLQDDFIDSLPLGAVNNTDLAPYLRLNNDLLNHGSVTVRERNDGSRYIALTNRSSGGLHDGFYILHRHASRPDATEFRVGDIVTISGRVGSVVGPAWHSNLGLNVANWQSGPGASHNIYGQANRRFTMSVTLTAAHVTGSHGFGYNAPHNAHMFFRIEDLLADIFIDDITVYRPDAGNGNDNGGGPTTYPPDEDLDFVWTLQDSFFAALTPGPITNAELAPFMQMNNDLAGGTITVNQRTDGRNYLALTNRTGGRYDRINILHSFGSHNPGAFQFQAGDVITVSGRLGDTMGAGNPWENSLRMHAGNWNGPATYLGIEPFVGGIFSISHTLTAGDVSNVNPGMEYNAPHNANIAFRITDRGIDVFIDNITIYRPDAGNGNDNGGGGPPVYPPDENLDFHWTLQDSFFDALTLGPITAAEFSPFLRINNDLAAATMTVNERTDGRNYLAFTGRNSQDNDRINILHSFGSHNPGATEFQAGDVVTVSGRLSGTIGSGNILRMQAGNWLAPAVYFNASSIVDGVFSISLTITDVNVSTIDPGMQYNAPHNGQVVFRILDRNANVFIDNITVYRPDSAGISGAMALGAPDMVAPEDICEEVGETDIADEDDCKLNDGQYLENSENPADTGELPEIVDEPSSANGKKDVGENTLSKYTECDKMYLLTQYKED